MKSRKPARPDFGFSHASQQAKYKKAQWLLTSVQQGSGVATMMMMMKEKNSGETNHPCTAATSIDTMEVEEETKNERGEMGEVCSDGEKQSLEVAEEETPSDSSELADGLQNATLTSRQFDEGI